MLLSRNQFKAQAETLKKKTSTTSITDSIALSFMAIAKDLIRLFRVLDPSSAATLEKAAPSISLRNPCDVMDIVRTMLSAPSIIFTESFFKRPLYGLATLHEIVELFGSASVPESYIENLHLSQSDSTNRRIKLHVWLCYAVKVDAEYCLSVIQKFKSMRGSPNPLIAGQCNSGNATPTTINPISGIVQNSNASLPAAAMASGDGPSNVPFTQIQTLPFSLQGHQHGTGAGDNAPVVNPMSHLPPTQGYDDPKKPNYAVLNMKDSKISGDIKQDVKDTTKMYEICARQYSLSERCSAMPTMKRSSRTG